MRFGEGAADHDGVRAAGERLADVAAFAHAAVGDDRNVARCFLEISVARRGAIDRRGDLRDAEPKDAARSAGGARSDADQDRGRTAFHDLEGGVVTDGVADDDRDPHVAAKFRELERFVFGRNVPDRRDGALHDKNVGTRFLRDARRNSPRVAESSSPPPARPHP